MKLKGINRIMTMGVFLIAIALFTGTNEKQVYAQEFSPTTTTLPTTERIVDSNTIEKVTGKTHIATVSAAPQFTQNNAGTWINITDYINLSLTANGLNVSWEDGYVTLEPMVNYSGTVYTWSQIPLPLRTAIVNKYDTIKERGHHKWAFNVSKIPNALKNNVNGIGFQVIRNTTPVSFDTTSLIANNKVALDFSDVLDSFNLSISNATTVWITNVSGLNEIYIDPIVTINASNATISGATSKS